jgi:hypothetical protein
MANVNIYVNPVKRQERSTAREYSEAAVYEVAGKQQVKVRV